MSQSNRRGATRVGWDGPEIHRQLAGLILTRAGFRLRRTVERIRSPRRLVATTLGIGFFTLYLLNGIFILSARQPADPLRLRLWLSGGMVLYALYHCLRCVWSRETSDLELTDAENLWLGGAPIERSSLAIYHVGAMVMPAALKTLLLAVVLALDVARPELLVVGVFSSLVLLEITRLIIARWSVGLEERRRHHFRIAVSLIALCIGAPWIARVLSMTPSGSATWLYLLNGFGSLGQLASSEIIQWASLPWIPAASLAVTDHYSLRTAAQLLAAASMLPLAVWTLVRVDAMSSHAGLRREQQRLAEGSYATARSEFQAIELSSSSRWQRFVAEQIPQWLHDTIALIERQWVSVNRYRGTILFSFLIPMLLCLSPLVTGQVSEQWFYVVGGIGLCTMLLAPPALRIDFRRDLRRMLLLRSLPVRPLSMVLGQLFLPILITWIYQWITIAITVMVTQPAWEQVLLWTALLNALAVFTFAMENALFLAYPHHERAEGVTMMIRAKLTFLGKGTVIVLALALLVAWAALCRGTMPPQYSEAAFVVGAVVATWCIAAAAIAITTVCWKRFDAAMDIPPQ